MSGNIVSIRQNNAIVRIEGVTIRDGIYTSSCCYPGVNAQATTRCDSGGSNATNYTGVDLTIVDSVITENTGRFHYTGITFGGTATNRSTLTLVDTEVSYNDSISASNSGPFAFYTDVTCEGSVGVDAGFWGQDYGFYMGANSTFAAVDCDFNSNTVDLYSPWIGSYRGLGADADITCDTSSCR